MSAFDDLDEFRAIRELRRPNIEVQKDFRGLFLGSDQGRRVLTDLLHMCRVGDITTAVKSDPYDTYAREGQRSIGQKIKLILAVDVPVDPITRQNTREDDSWQM